MTENISIPLVKDTNFDITPEYMQELTESFPNLNVKQELKLLAAWNQANPRRRKTLRGICRHINSWMTRKQTCSTGNNWSQVVGAYFRPLSQDEVKVWESEFAVLLNPAPGDQELVAALREVVSSPQGKPQFLNVWDLVKVIRATRKKIQAAELTEEEIRDYVETIRDTPGLEARWDLICEHPNPMRVEEACNQAGIPFLRPHALIQDAQQATLGLRFRCLY